MKTALRLLCVQLLALSLSACVLSDKAAQIQAKAQELCGFWPAYEIVVKILAAAAEPQLPSAPAVVGDVIPIARSICAAMTATRSQQALISGCPSVNGICIEGEWKREGEE